MDSRRDQYYYYLTEQPPNISYTSSSPASKESANNHIMSPNLPLSPLPSKSSTTDKHSFQQREEGLISPLQISNFDWETAAAVSIPQNHATDYYSGVQHSAYMPLPFDSNACQPESSRRALCPGVFQQSIPDDHVNLFSQHLPPAQAHEAAVQHSAFNATNTKTPLPPRSSAPLRSSTVAMAPPESMYAELLHYAAAMQHNAAETANAKQESPNYEEIFSNLEEEASIHPDFPSSQGVSHEQQPHHEPDQVSCDQNLPTHPTTLSISSDESFLDPVHNFLRSACVEVFVASDHNAGRGAKPHQIGQVGLRCGHCKHIHRSKRAKQAVSYPSKTINIFESVRNFQRTHFEACGYIPDALKVRYKKLMCQLYRKIHQKYIKAYFAEAGCEIGLMDTPNGIIFGAPPNLSGKPSEKLSAIMKLAEDPVASAHLEDLIFPKVDRRLENMKFSHIASENTRQVIASCRKQKSAFVYPSDFPAVSDFRFVLFHQFCPCRPPSSALNRRKSRPEKWDTLSGLCCRYCAKAYPGKRNHKGMYCPLDLESLHDSSLSHNLTVHIMTCENAPFETKEALEELQRLAVESGVITKRGSKKKFLQKLWERMANYYPAP
mmetsp:Transcript_17188/g.26176  ORF Transcript_17188/g.26176 Transcript_17188/m.26176 type:complete len:606 (-) Transcript_17188:156-1973(-)